MCLSYLAEVIKTWCMFIGALFLAIFFVITCAIFWILRQIVRLLALVFKPNVLDQMLVGFDIYFVLSEENIRKIPSKNINVLLILEGQVSRDTLVRELNELTTSVTAKKLRQFPTKWLGYYFYQWEAPFQISSHVKSVEGINLENVNLFMESNLKSPFPKNRAMWEVVLFPNFDPDRNTGVQLRLHHSIGDGFSLLSQLDTGLITNLPGKVREIETSPTRKSIISQIYNFISIPRRYLVEARTELSLSFAEQISQPACHLARTNGIDLEDIKRTKNNLKTTLGSILNSAIARTLAASFNEGILNGNPKNLEYITGYSPFLIPGHPDKEFVNRFGLGRMDFQMDENADLASSLKFSNQTISNLPSYVSPMVNGVISGLVYQLPTFLAKHFMPKHDILFINIVGPSMSTTVFNHVILDMSFWVPTLARPWISFTTLSYNGFLKIGCIGSSYTVKSNEAAEKLCKKLEDEIRNLVACASPTE